MFAPRNNSPTHRVSPSFSALLNNQCEEEVLPDPLFDIPMEEDVLQSIFDPVAIGEEEVNDIVISEQQALFCQNGVDSANASASVELQGTVTQTVRSAGNADLFPAENPSTSEQTDQEPALPTIKLSGSLGEDPFKSLEIDLSLNQPSGTRLSGNFPTNQSPGLGWDIEGEDGEDQALRTSTQKGKSIVGMAQMKEAAEDGDPLFLARGREVTVIDAMGALPSHVCSTEPFPKLSSNDQLDQTNTGETSLTKQNKMEISVGQFLELESGVTGHQKELLSFNSLLLPKGACRDEELAGQAEQGDITVVPEGSKEEGLTNMLADIVCGLQVNEHNATQSYPMDGHDALTASPMGRYAGESTDFINPAYAQNESMEQTSAMNEESLNEEKMQTAFARNRSKIDAPSESDDLEALLNEHRHEDGTMSVSDDRSGQIDRQRQRRQKKKRTRVEDMDPAEVHVCPIADCRKKFAKKYNLKIHERRHRGDLPFLCPRCSKKFMWQSSFERHLRVHEARAGGYMRRSRGTRGTKNGQGSKRKYYEVEQICNTVSTMMLQGNVMNVNHLDPCSVTLAASLGVLNGVAEEEYKIFFEEGIEDGNVYRVNKKRKINKEEDGREGENRNLALAQE